LERKNGKRKNPNVHVLQYFGLYNKYHLLDYKMNKENASKLWKIIQEAGDYLSVQRFSLVHLG